MSQTSDDTAGQWEVGHFVVAGTTEAESGIEVERETLVGVRSIVEADIADDTIAPAVQRSAWWDTKMGLPGRFEPVEAIERVERVERVEVGHTKRTVVRSSGDTDWRCTANIHKEVVEHIVVAFEHIDVVAVPASVERHRPVVRRGCYRIAIRHEKACSASLTAFLKS